MTDANDFTWDPVRSVREARHAWINGVDFPVAGVKDCPWCGEDHPDIGDLVVELQP